ncbi:CsbD family protein [Mycolicibacterium thermoresistibile]
MSGSDKARNQAQGVLGKAKQAFGRLTGDRAIEDRGRGDQAKSDLKGAGEKVKDAFKKR